MPTAIRSLNEVLAVTESEKGTHWPNPWWPTGNRSFNDCAAMVSWALYGLDRSTPFITYVPRFMELAQTEQRWHSGSRGIQLGDLVIFDWKLQGSRDHIGIALSSMKETVTVRQTNNGGESDALADISYSLKYVLGFYRPRYKQAPGGVLAVDGNFGPQTVRRLQVRLSVKADGSFGPQTKKALQRELAVPQDGNIGPITVRALQRRIGAVVDARWGPQTTRALQRSLNDGSF